MIKLKVKIFNLIKFRMYMYCYMICNKNIYIIKSKKKVIFFEDPIIKKDSILFLIKSLHSPFKCIMIVDSKKRIKTNLLLINLIY